jgi:outer membrane immunogenic protein
MRRIALGLLATASLVMLGSLASAADLARPVYKAAPPPVPVFSWTGFYIGAHVGAGWSTVESDITSIGIGGRSLGLGLPLSSSNNNGFLGGGQIGGDYQAGWAVFGAELSGSWTNIKGHSPCLIVLTCATEHNWLLTAAGRFGVAWNQTLVYVKGGVAWADPQYSASLTLGGLALNTEVQERRTGALFGAGIEQAIANGWSAKVEYNYIDFGTNNLNFPVTVGRLPINVAADVNEKMHTIKFGLNYRFGGYGSVGY